jgi:hypothetical protein
VSILKKSNSNRQLQQPDYAYDSYYQDTVPYDDVEDDDYLNYNQGAMYSNDYDYEYGYEQPTRHYAAAPMRAPIRQRSSSSMVADRNRYNNSRQQMMHEQDYHSPMDPPRRRRSRSRNEDYSYNDAPVPVYYDDMSSSYYDTAPPVHSAHPSSSRRARDHYQPVSHGAAAMRSSSNSSSRRSSLAANSNNRKPQDYYGLSAKLTPFMMEEWEITLDELCDLFPRLDRQYINDFLRSAQGDFITAKNMIMEMIMEIR